MTETQAGKTQILLEQAARQKNSDAAGASSMTDAARHYASAAEAENAFSLFREKLLRIERWNSCSGISSFTLFDKKGNPRLEEKADGGDFIKIILPGSGKDDWVNVIEIYDTPNEIVITVQPCHDPTDEENETTTSHFFTGDSTNNFCLQRRDLQITIHVIGLNEKSNTADTSGIIETIRNVATAKVGQYLGIQKIQWKTFCENFLEDEKAEV